MLAKCISDNQSAFVLGRSILDNIMVAIEVVHHMKTKTRGNICDIALKLDISKAYDRIDWLFKGYPCHYGILSEMEWVDYALYWNYGLLCGYEW